MPTFAPRPCYVAGVQTSDGAKAVAAAALKDASPSCKRRAAEALVRQGLTPTPAELRAGRRHLRAAAATPIAFVRYSGRLALEHTPRTEWAQLVMAETNVIALTEGLLALDQHAGAAGRRRSCGRSSTSSIALMKQTDAAGRAEDPRAARVRGRRDGNARTASIPRSGNRSTTRSSASFPATAPAATLDRLHEPRSATDAACAQLMLTHHMAKVLAYTGEPDVIGKILAVMPKGDDDQPGQIDYMYALRVIDKGWTRARGEDR